MPNIIDRQTLDFFLYDWLGADKLCEHPRFDMHSRDVFDQILDTAEKLSEDVLQPWAAGSDIHEPEFEDGKAIIPSQTKDCLDAIIENGFAAGGFEEKYGGLNLPYLVAQAYSTFFAAANGGVHGYLMLTGAAANLLKTHGAQEHVDRFVPPMVEGRFFGTMCLSEPQAGSSLADIRMRAEPQDDGTYRLFGNKMWISGGDHELSENIIHLVLGKIPGGQAGVKGISLFIVPKFLLDENGNPSERNDVQLAGVNHKMGNRATINTFLSFGENGGAKGYLLGEPGKGLAYMFHMMNEARIAVGLGAAALANTGYLHALEYAKDRTQGRGLTSKDPTKPMVPIIQHADVKRMLLQQKSYAEGALALCLYGGRLVDDKELSDGEAELRIHNLLEILTPIMKSWPSEFGLQANDLAIQVHGGYGYTREYAVERFYRDNRLNPIHEGTKGIQGLDLLGRKVVMNGGAALDVLGDEILATCVAAKDFKNLSAFSDQLETYWSRLISVTNTMKANSVTVGPEAYTANATLYLDTFGHVVVSWIWLQLGLAVMRSGDHESDFAKGKLQALAFFFGYELIKTNPAFTLLESLDTTCLNMKEDWF